MTFGEIKDQVREHFGRVGWNTTMLDQAMSSARREIEKYGNYYWMRSTGTFNTTASTQTYPLTSGTINKPNFKDIRALHVKKSTETMWSEVQVGQTSQEEAELLFTTDETGFPQLAIVDNITLILFPIPNDTYNMKLFHWEWTSNLSNLESDELSNRFPEALIYGSLVWGCDQFEKDHPEADRWRALFALELKKIHSHSFERELQDKVSIIPMRGAFVKRAWRPSKNIWI